MRRMEEEGLRGEGKELRQKRKRGERRDAHK